MLTLSLFALLALGNENIQVVTTFDDPSKTSDDFIRQPYSMDFGPDGRLYILDMSQSQVFVWRPDGSFIKAFGSPGEGPGELQLAMQIHVDAENVYAWEHRQKIQVFSLDGEFKHAIRTNGVQPRQFGVLKNGKILIGYQDLLSDGAMNMVFGILDPNGGEISKLKSFPDESLLSKIKDENINSNQISIKGYSPDIDVQLGPNGNWYFGFGQYSRIFEVNGSSGIVKTHELEIPTGKASDHEKELLLNMSFPGPGGKRMKVKDIPGQKITFDYNKAYFTNFTLKGDRGVFILTTLGGAYGSGNGFWEAPYYIMDMKTGKPLATGHYAYPEDSTVLFRNGRILACVANKNGEYEIKEISLKGF